jgi:threonine dehydratase
MPAKASRAKVDASRGYGAEVVLHGASSIEAFAKAHELEAERHLTFISPFDHPEVIAGAGTVALELLEQVSDLDAVVIPIGGGGLIAGMATAIKAIAPGVRIFGVEPQGAPSMRRSLDAGRAVRLDAVQTIADGLAAPMAGELTYPVVRDLVEDVVHVTDDEIAAAMRAVLLYAKVLAEPAGAAATAAILTRKLPLSEGARVASILSGGNVDLTKLRDLLAE